MAKLEVIVSRIELKEHPNADRLQIARIVGSNYHSIVPNGNFKPDDLVAYIPEGSIIPDHVLREMGLEGKLAGSSGNRLKSQRLRGVLSQGLCYPARPEWEEGQDVTEELGIEKYVPKIPVDMGGEVYALGPAKTMKYDLENIKRFPEVLEEGEEVCITEKIHGTNFCAGVLLEEDQDPEHGRLVVHSKGLGSKGLVFKPNSEANKDNLYLKAARIHGLLEKLKEAVASYGKPVFILAEVYGIQDLSYGCNSSDIGLAVFDVHIGYESDGHYLNVEELDAFMETYDIPGVPVLYRGPFSEEVLEDITDGQEQVTGDELHIREGVVIKPVLERRHLRLGRVILKNISESYLVRGGEATEYN